MPIKKNKSKNNINVQSNKKMNAVKIALLFMFVVPVLALLQLHNLYLFLPFLLNLFSIVLSIYLLNFRQFIPSFGNHLN